MIPILMRWFRRRNRMAFVLGVHEGCTVIVWESGHRWFGQAGFCNSEPDRWGYVEVVRNGETELIHCNRLSTRLSFAISYDKKPTDRK
jgi:hypothetical protein